MDDSNIDKIKNNISNNFSKLNANNFILKVKNSLSITECVTISDEFIESIKEIKSNIISFISDELNIIKQTLEEKEVSNNIFHNEILVLFNNIKNIITQNKLKIKNISSNINDIYTGMNLINSNIEKKKYSLASNRISKIINIKNNILSNIKQLETNQQKILDELGNEKNSKFNNSNNNFKVKPAPTPFPVTSYFSLEKSVKKRTNTLSNSNLNNNTMESTKKKMVKRRRDFSLSLRENSVSNLRNTSVNNTNTPLKAYNTINNFFKKENKEEELNKKLLNQIKINDKLKREIELLKEKINLSTIMTDQSSNNNLRIFNNQNIINFKEKINAISDIIFSLTFSFNELQNKNRSKSSKENDKVFSDIKKNLLDITTEISELKSILYQISLDNNDDITNNNNNNQMSLNSSDLIKSTNQSINFTEDLYSINDTNINNKNAENNLNEINILKDKLRTSEKKLMELKNIYDSDIESRNLIENLLKKNLEENKATYEVRISKYKKKLEEKEKEIEEIRKKVEKEEMEILNKIKKDNEENIKKLKNIYEIKLNNNKKYFQEKYSDLQEEKSINLIIISTSISNDLSFEKEEMEKKLEKIEKEKRELEIILEKEKMKFRENNNNNLNQILELKNQILNYKNKENELNEEINLARINNEKKLKKLEIDIKDKITQEKNEEINKIENELNEINNKLNKKDKEIIALITNRTKEKKNLMEQTNNQMEKFKKEIDELKQINKTYKEQVNSLQKKLFDIEKISNDKINNISIEKESELTLVNKIIKEKVDPNINLIQKTEISLNILSSLNSNFPRKRSKNISINNNNSIEDESNSEESEDFYDYENEENEEFIKRMKKINKKNKLDNVEMKKFRKENRKMIYKLEDTLDEVDELKEKMIKIEKIVSEKQEQLYNSLKKYFNKILTDVNYSLNLNNDNSENFIYFMKLMQFSDEEIKNIISLITSQNPNSNNNTKKKIQFNIFK